MDLNPFSWWDFIPELTEESEIHCNECGEWSHMKDWTMGEVGCQDCGSHAALVCPLCGEYFDHVWSYPFETRPLTNVSPDLLPPDAKDVEDDAWIKGTQIP